MKGCIVHMTGQTSTILNQNLLETSLDETSHGFGRRRYSLFTLKVFLRNTNSKLFIGNTKFLFVLGKDGT